MELHGIPMHRYTLDKSALDVNNVTVFTKGVFDVSRVSGGPLFFSLPRFLHGGSLHEELDLPAPEEKKHESFVSIRIFSGNFVCLCVCELHKKYLVYWTEIFGAGNLAVSFPSLELF